MKRIIALILAGIMCVSLASCSSVKNKTVSDESKTEPTQTETETQTQEDITYVTFPDSYIPSAEEACKAFDGMIEKIENGTSAQYFTDKSREFDYENIRLIEEFILERKGMYKKHNTSCLSEKDGHYFIIYEFYLNDTEEMTDYCSVYDILTFFNGRWIIDESDGDLNDELYNLAVSNPENKEIFARLNGGQVCPDCEGTGQIFSPEFDENGVVIQDYITCPTCGGHGFVN